MRAGLAVALQRTGWEIHIFTPTSYPLKMLAANYNSTRAQSGQPHLILVDQFEETFTLCRDEQERSGFIERLLSIAHDPLLRTTLVIALRADFYSHCAQYHSRFAGSPPYPLRSDFAPGVRTTLRFPLPFIASSGWLSAPRAGK